MIPEPSEPDPAPAAGGADSAEKKRKDKVQAAWIAFFGRILAQVLGAVASVTLGLFVLNRYQTGKNEKSSTVPTPAPKIAASRSPGTPSLAVLPLANLSGDPGQEYFADGMTEALIADLAQIDGVRVISRTSSMLYKGEKKSLPQVAQELGVGLIVEGSVNRSGGRVRVTAQLIDASNDEHLWARSYDRKGQDVLALQGELAAAIAREVKGALSATLQGRLTERKPIDPAVYDLYLHGRYAWNRRTSESLQEAVVFFEQAIAKDPGFALAHAGLADTLSLYTEAPNGRGRAKAAALRAIELDDRLAEAHTSLAAVLHRDEGDLEAAEREFRRALELNPGYATTHQWYAIMLAEEGRDAEASAQARQAVRLDPLSGVMHQSFALIEYYGRRYDVAIASARRALELAPQLPVARVTLARALIVKGSPKEVIPLFEPAGPPLSADALGMLGLAHLRGGDRARSETILKELTGRSPRPTTVLARWYAASGDSAAALDMLEQTLAGGIGLQQVKSDPIFDGVRTDPRFVDLLARAHAVRRRR